jgi:hypothetical protein
MSQNDCYNLSDTAWFTEVHGAPGLSLFCLFTYVAGVASSPLLLLPFIVVGARKPAPVPLCPPQIPQDLTRARTWVAALGSRRLTA